MKHGIFQDPAIKSIHPSGTCTGQMLSDNSCYCGYEMVEMNGGWLCMKCRTFWKDGEERKPTEGHLRLMAARREQDERAATLTEPSRD